MATSKRENDDNRSTTLLALTGAHPPLLRYISVLKLVIGLGIVLSRCGDADTETKHFVTRGLE